VGIETGQNLSLCPPPDPSPHPPTRFTVPAGAVDTHAHVIGDAFIEERSYTPPPAPGEKYLAMLDATGMTYGVLVQVSVHGTDNRLLVDMLRAHPDRLRGVAVVPPDVADAELSILKDAGVTGLRLNTLSGGGVGFGNIDRYERICQELGWHLQLLATPTNLEDIAPRLLRLRVPYVIDHMGDFDVAAGTGAPAWQTMLRLMSEGGWTKLSGAFRLSQSAPYADTIPFARSLAEAAPDRCVYGSDWPHVGFFGPMPNVGDLLDLLADWAPEPVERTAILTTNAHRLYGFPPAGDQESPR
jgi:predicted TIM-barrel fold metal-dependent hydrolase